MHQKCTGICHFQTKKTQKVPQSPTLLLHQPENNTTPPHSAAEILATQVFLRLSSSGRGKCPPPTQCPPPYTYTRTHKGGVEYARRALTSHTHSEFGRVCLCFSQ